MKFTTTIAATICGFASVISAYPTGAKIVPDNISIYHGYGGKIEYNVADGRVSRNQGGNDDISTLLTFTFPAASAGRKCTFKFALDNSHIPSGSKMIDVFRSSQYATADSEGWGAPSNYRDVQLGRLKPVAGGEATVEWGNFEFDCPAGQTKGFEITPTGDNCWVDWKSGVDGPYISY